MPTLRFTQSQPMIQSAVKPRTNQQNMNEAAVIKKQQQQPPTLIQRSNFTDQEAKRQPSTTNMKQAIGGGSKGNDILRAADQTPATIVGKGRRQTTKGLQDQKKPSVFRRLFANGGKRHGGGRKGKAKGTHETSELSNGPAVVPKADKPATSPKNHTPNKVAATDKVQAGYTDNHVSNHHKANDSTMGNEHCELKSGDPAFAMPRQPFRPVPQAPEGQLGVSGNIQSQPNQSPSTNEPDHAKKGIFVSAACDPSELMLPILHHQASVSAIPSSAFSIHQGTSTKTPEPLPGQTPPNSPCQTARPTVNRAVTPENTIKQPLVPPPLQRRSSWFARRSRSKDAPNKPVRSVSPPPPGKRATNKMGDGKYTTKDNELNQPTTVPVQQHQEGMDESESDPSESNTYNDRWSPAADMFYDGGLGNILEPPKLPARRRQPDEDIDDALPIQTRKLHHGRPKDCPEPPPILSPSNPSATGIVAPRATRPQRNSSPEKNEHRNSCTLDHHPANMVCQNLKAGSAGIIRPTLSSSDEDDEEVSLLSEQASISRQKQAVPTKSILKKTDGFRVVSPASTASLTPSPISMGGGHALDTTPMRGNSNTIGDDNGLETSLDSSILSATPRASPKRFARFDLVEIRECKSKIMTMKESP